MKTRRLQVVEFVDYYVQLENFVVLFCKNERSVNEKIYVGNCPLTICKAVGEDFTDTSFLWSSLNEHLLKRPPKCCKLECECGGDTHGIFRHPCARERRELVEAPVTNVQIIRSRGFDMYEQNDRPFVQITLNKSLYVQSAAAFLEKFDVGYVDPALAGIYDKTSNGVDEFLLSKRIGSFDWIEIPDDGSNVVDYSEVRVVTSEMDGVETELVSLYLDIETIRPLTDEKYNETKNRQAEYLVGIVSTTLVTTKGRRENRSFMLKVDGVEDLPDEETTFYEDERDLLMALQRYFLESDVDVFLGYNSNRFDFPYLLRRAERLGLPDFRMFSRLVGEPVVFRESVSSSKQSGAKKQTLFNCPGRIFLDIYPMVKKTYKFGSYKLKSVADELNLDVSKDDVDYDDIPAYFFGTPEQRSILLKYCKKDVLVSVILGEKKMDVVRRMAVSARLYGVSAQQIPDRGNSYLLGMMLRRRMGESYIINSAKFNETLRASFASIEGYPELWRNALKGKKYPGAFVFEPEVGLWECPVITLDFNSLYPSTMITFNICLSTQVAHADRNDPDLNVSPAGFGYVKEHIRKGMLPRLVSDLIAERTAVRERLEVETDESRRAMMDAEQNALKVAANSYYGLMGALTSILSSLSAAYSVTSYGRYYIQRTCDALMELPNFASKYGMEVERPGFIDKYGLRIIYGDTDSLFIALTKVTDYDLVMKEIGPEIKEWVNKKSGLLTGRLKMGFENCSMPFYLLSKKKYAKHIYDEKKKKFVLKLSGIGNRSSTKYCTKVMETVFNMKIVNKKPREYIEAFIAEACRKVWDDEVPRELMVHSSNLSKELAKYDADTCCTVAAKQMRQAGLEVNEGDRVAYFFCNLTRNKDCKKSDLVVADELMIPSYELHRESYVAEIIETLKCTALSFVLGKTKRDCQKRLEYLGSIGAKRQNSAMMKQPARISHGPMNEFVPTEAARAPKRAKIVEERRKLVIDDESKIKEMLKLLNPMESFCTRGEMPNMPAYTPTFSAAKRQKVVKQLSLKELFMT